jgi:phosphohistidine phosphatase
VRLYLVRHADAEQGEPDALRRLSRKGRDQARRLGAKLAAEDIHPDAILTSPLLRARETAEHVGRATGTGVTADERLAPGATAASVRNAIAGHGDHVVVVGHQPDCGRIAAELTGRDERPFPKGSMVVIDLS